MTEVLVLGLQNFNKITSILLYQKNGCEGRMKVMLVMLHLTQIQFCEREKKDQICEKNDRPGDDGTLRSV